jgi:hypothetical protein
MENVDSRRITVKCMLICSQIALGPRSTRAGRNNIALRSASTPPTAIPTILNGNSSNQTMGYSTSASNATGQHRMNKMHHNRNAAIRFPPVYVLRERHSGSFLHGMLKQAKPPRKRGRHFRIHNHVRVLYGGVQHPPHRMHQRQCPPFCHRQPKR